jgi:hypothetical protein
MAQDLIKAGMIKSPKQYINVVMTGNLDVLTENDEADQLLILEENEWLSEGKPVRAVITEMHPDHIKGHMSVLSSPQAKEDPQLAQNVTEHILEHIDLWTTASIQKPGLLAALNIPPIPMPQQMGLPGMSPQDGGSPGPAGAPGKLVGGGEPPAQRKAQEVKPAGMPTNPATGEPAEVPGAGPPV